MLLPAVLLAFVVWTLIKGTTAKYASYATEKGADPSAPKMGKAK